MPHWEGLLRGLGVVAAAWRCGAILEDVGSFWGSKRWRTMTVK